MFAHVTQAYECDREGEWPCLQKRTTKAGISREISNIHFHAASYHPEEGGTQQTLCGVYRGGWAPLQKRNDQGHNLGLRATVYWET